jgi:hypothetical protein
MDFYFPRLLALSQSRHFSNESLRSNASGSESLDKRKGSESDIVARDMLLLLQFRTQNLLVHFSCCHAVGHERSLVNGEDSNDVTPAEDFSFNLIRKVGYSVAIGGGKGRPWKRTKERGQRQGFINRLPCLAAFRVNVVGHVQCSDRILQFLEIFLASRSWVLESCWFRLPLPGNAH